MLAPKLVQTGDARDTLRRVVHASNFSPVVLAFPLGPAPETVIDINVNDLGAISVDRAVFRRLLPDDRWYVYAAGRVDPSDNDGVTVELAYVKDDNTAVVLGGATWTGAGMLKKALGPFDLFGTVGVPRTENIVVVRLQATKLVASTAEMRDWTLWLRLLPSKQ